MGAFQQCVAKRALATAGSTEDQNTVPPQDHTVAVFGRAGLKGQNAQDLLATWMSDKRDGDREAGSGSHFDIVGPDSTTVRFHDLSCD